MKSQVGTVCFSKFPFSYKTKNWKSYLCLSHIQLTSYTKFTKQAMHELLLLLYFLFPHMSFIKEKILMGTHYSMEARERDEFLLLLFLFSPFLLRPHLLTQFMHSTTVVSFSFLAFLYFLVASSSAFTLQPFAGPHGLIFNQGIGFYKFYSGIYTWRLTFSRIFFKKI